MGPQLMSRQATSLNVYRGDEGSEHSWLGPAAAAVIGMVGASQGSVAAVDLPSPQPSLVVTQGKKMVVANCHIDGSPIPICHFRRA